MLTAVYRKPNGEFQHTAARRRLLAQGIAALRLALFQHTAARRRLPFRTSIIKGNGMFQHTAARRRLQKVKI